MLRDKVVLLLAGQRREVCKDRDLMMASLGKTFIYIFTIFFKINLLPLWEKRKK
jgi:hypothetical protein